MDRYEEALKMARTKIKHDKDHVLYENDIFDIFPELAESKDERIRKAIINGMTALKEQGGKTFAAIHINDCIAWLEKQNSNVDNANKEYWRGYREGKQEILDKYAELEKQGGQNPQRMISAEAKEAMYNKPAWSEEDQNALEDVREAVVHYWGGDTQDILLYWLKTLKQRIGG